MPRPAWDLRPASYDDGELLADIVVAATKDQGRWPEMSPVEEDEWRAGFAKWSRESVDGADELHVIEVDGAPVGRLRTEADTTAIGGVETPRLLLAGIQLRPQVQRRGIGTAIVQALQAQVASTGGVLEVGVERDNPHARRLYERLGCVEVGGDDREVLLRWTPSG